MRLRLVEDNEESVDDIVIDLNNGAPDNSNEVNNLQTNQKEIEQNLDQNFKVETTPEEIKQYLKTAGNDKKKLDFILPRLEELSTDQLKKLLMDGDI